MIQIKNKTQLIENGKTPLLQKARTLALESLEYGLTAVDPKRLLRAKLSLKDSILSVENCSFDLNRYRNILVVGGGKAGGVMAEALEEMLGNRITAGAINVPYGSKQETRIIKISEAGHPVPDLAGVEGTCRIIAIAEQAAKEDLVICLISGGGSSLMPLPRGNVLLEDKKALTNALIKSGAPIQEINIVRKHLSAFKGGWLAKKAYPATVLNLILSDVIGDPLDAIASGPAVPDPTTFADAKSILEKYNLWADAPASVRKVLSDGVRGVIEETPKPADPVFERVYNVILGNIRTASLGTLDYLKSKGLNVHLLSTALEGEARQAGRFLASIALDADSLGKPLSKPLGIVAGGETTVTVRGKGVGGRNQELSLSAALKLGDAKTCVLASLSTDGVDGPTDAAGAIVDGFTIARAEQAGLDVKKALADNDSYRFFYGLDDLIITGLTGTNVNDISVIIIL
jgi:glycerate 2-kinase